MVGFILILVILVPNHLGFRVKSFKVQIWFGEIIEKIGLLHFILAIGSVKVILTM